MANRCRSALPGTFAGAAAIHRTGAFARAGLCSPGSGGSPASLAVRRERTGVRSLCRQMPLFSEKDTDR